MNKTNYKTKNYFPTKIKEGDWVIIMQTKERGCVHKVYNDGERYAIVVPSGTDWPFPRWIWIDGEKVRKSSMPKELKPKEEKETQADVQDLISTLGKPPL